MEEKKIQLRQEDVDWLKDKIRWSVLPGYSIAYEEDYDKIVEEMMKLFTSSNTKHSNSENIEKNLKPFNLEAVKAGLQEAIKLITNENENRNNRC